MAFIPYLPHLIYSIAITSVSIHLIAQRRSADTQRAQANAQISILESIAQQLRSPNPLSPDELDKLRRLAQPPEQDGIDSRQIAGAGIGWRDVVLGKRAEKSAQGSAWDVKDLDDVRREIEKAS